MTPSEELVVATHEAGHAIVNLMCDHAKAIDRISIRGDMAGALGFVRYQDPARRYVVTQNELRDDICILMGGREAELLLLGDLSIGSSGDLTRATDIARALVEDFGMGTTEVGVGRFSSDTERDGRRSNLSAGPLEALDRNVREVLESERQRAASILQQNSEILKVLKQLLLKQKTLETSAITAFLDEHGVNEEPSSE